MVALPPSLQLPLHLLGSWESCELTLWASEPLVMPLALRGGCGW